MKGLFFIILFICSLPITSEEINKRTLEKIKRASVEIHLNRKLKGGGAIVRNKKGKFYIITAAHLFNSFKDTCKVITHDNKSYFASLSSYDLGNDIALLEIDPNIKKYGYLQISTNPLIETERIYNFAPALKRRIMIIPGMISDNKVSYSDFPVHSDYISHFFVSSINPYWTSGSVWVNKSGKIIGIQHGILAGNKEVSSGFSLVSFPRLISQIIEKNSISKTPSLGGFVSEIKNLDYKLISKIPPNVNGLIVTHTFKNRPLNKCGINKDDIIISCNKIPTRKVYQLIYLIRSKAPETQFNLYIYRPCKKKYFNVQLITDCLENNWK